VASGGPQVVAWELGNELDIKGHGKNFSPALAAADFAILIKANVSTGRPGSQPPRRPMLWGSDPTNGGTVVSRTLHSQWFADFVGNLTAGKVWLDGLTYHHYYKPAVNGSAAADYFDHFLWTALNATAIHRQYCAAAAAAGVATLPLLVLGETGGPLVPGTTGQTPDTLVTTLWTFDKLAIAAITGHAAVARHQWGVILGRPAPTATPDGSNMPGYWPLVAWKRIIGDRVVPVDGSLSPGRVLRVYAFCAAQSAADLVVLAINVGHSRLPLVLANATLASLPRAEYHFAAAAGDTDTQLLMNGVVLRLEDPDGAPRLPALVPARAPRGSVAVLAPRSAAIFTYQGAHAAACF
jgi:hypothetical protein